MMNFALQMMNSALQMAQVKAVAHTTMMETHLSLTAAAVRKVKPLACTRLIRERSISIAGMYIRSRPILHACTRIDRQHIKAQRLRGFGFGFAFGCIADTLTDAGGNRIDHIRYVLGICGSVVATAGLISGLICDAWRVAAAVVADAAGVAVADGGAETTTSEEQRTWLQSQSSAGSGGGGSRGSRSSAMLVGGAKAVAAVVTLQGVAKGGAVRETDAIYFVYTCRRLIGLSALYTHAGD